MWVVCLIAFQTVYYVTWREDFWIYFIFPADTKCFCVAIMAQESMTVWETAEAARQQQHWRWWLEEDTQSIPYTDTSHSYLISKRARRRQESSSYSIRRGLYDKLFWCTMEKRIVEELMTSQKDSQSSSSDRIKKKKEIPIMKSWVGKILLWWCWILAHLTLYWIYRDFQTQWILGLCKKNFFPTVSFWTLKL